MTIDAAFEILMGFEGGLVNNPNDPGGLTKYGISKAAYPNLDIANLTEDTARAIYATDYWKPAGCDSITPELQYVVFDTSVNCGSGTAIKILEEMGGHNTLERCLFYREVYDTEIVEHRQKQIEFLGGWTNRNKQILTLHDNGKL